MLNVVIKATAILFGGYIIGDLLSDHQEPQVVIQTEPPSVPLVHPDLPLASPSLIISFAILVVASGYVIRAIRKN